MSSYPYHLIYYQGHLNKGRPSGTTDSIVKAKAKNKVPTAKQYAYFQDLIAFCKEHGLETSIFERAKMKSQISSAINGLKTIIQKNGLFSEWCSWEKKHENAIDKTDWEEHKQNEQT